MGVVKQWSKKLLLGISRHNIETKYIHREPTYYPIIIVMIMSSFKYSTKVVRGVANLSIQSKPMGFNKVHLPTSLVLFFYPLSCKMYQHKIQIGNTCFISSSRKFTSN